MLKRLLLVSFIGSMALTGCVRRYAVTMNNGLLIYTTSKPKLVHGNYVFKDGSGKEISVSQGQVTQIQPASMAKESNSQFLPSGR